MPPPAVRDHRALSNNVETRPTQRLKASFSLSLSSSSSDPFSSLDIVIVSELMVCLSYTPLSRHFALQPSLQFIGNNMASTGSRWLLARIAGDDDENDLKNSLLKVMLLRCCLVALDGRWHQMTMDASKCTAERCCWLK